MADPRNAVDFEGIDGVYATYLVDNATITFDPTKVGGSASAGLAVTISADRTVALTTDGSAAEGKIVLVEADGKANIQVGGYTRLPGGLAATLTRGTKFVGATGAAGARGYIRSAASATAAELLVARGSIEDASDPTAVGIRF